jgi:hypothetical protein
MMADEKREFGTSISNPKAWEVISKNADILTLNRVVFNLAERVKVLEDTMVQVVRLNMLMEQSLHALENRVNPPDEDTLN